MYVTGRRNKTLSLELGPALVQLAQDDNLRDGFGAMEKGRSADAKWPFCRCSRPESAGLHHARGRSYLAATSGWVVRLPSA